MTGSQRRTMWERRIAAWRASGATLHAFCAQQAISRESMRRWRRRLAGEQLQASHPKRLLASTLVPIHVGESALPVTAAGSPAIEIRLRGGRALVIAGAVDEVRLARLIGVVERAP